MYPVGFAADLDGDVAAFGDEAVVNRSLREHGGWFPFSERCTGPAQHTGPETALLEAGRSDQDGGDGVLGGPVAVAEGGDQAGVVVGELTGTVFGAGFREPGAGGDGVAVDADGLAGVEARPSRWRRSARSWTVWAKVRRVRRRGEGVGVGGEAEGGHHVLLAALRRRTTRRTAPQPRVGRRTRRSGDQRSLENYAFTMLSRQAPHLRTPHLRPLAKAWAQLGLWPHEMRAWMGAVGVDHAAVVRDCITAGIALSAMDTVLDGVRVKQRLRGGEPAFSVLARAESRGHILSA